LARHAFLRFRKRWQPEYPVTLRQLERDLPELLAFYSFPKPLWKKLRTTNLMSGFCGGATSHSAYGLFRECGQRRPHHLFNFNAST